MPIDFFRLGLISWVRAPAEEIFFLKSDIKWAFFISSNTLESYVTNLKVRTTSKLKNLYKNEQNSNRDLFVQYTKVVLYSIHNKVIGNLEEHPTSSHGVLVSTLDFQSIECRFESWLKQEIFIFFSSKMRQKVKKFVSLKARVPGKCQVIFYPL